MTTCILFLEIAPVLGKQLHKTKWIRIFPNSQQHKHTSKGFKWSISFQQLKTASVGTQNGGLTKGKKRYRRV